MGDSFRDQALIDALTGIVSHAPRPPFSKPVRARLATRQQADRLSRSRPPTKPPRP